MLCIIDYGSGNIAAIANICERERIPHIITHDPARFDAATHFLLPGVGAFDPTVETLRVSGILPALETAVMEQRKPIMGICVGMHLLADSSDEGRHQGLGWIPGHVTRIDIQALKQPPHLPHMGWNDIAGDPGDPLLMGVDLERGFYFLHSYFFEPHNPEDVVATVTYGTELPCIVRRGHVIGAQFHPEKSHANGIRLIKNFVGVA
ncbi:imidazole glycerol phosphate synthase subunit HisH [Roseitalea porphyridii]|uniref:Imidazole glycerol phosphate synthase subunit HisH n=1 Tax=Roseitalea porphyridii TaxID=1852022 RepID=A0A4P6V0H0_9HYPH|nr:imidazole glycerol phosphate synthase subunit HisH [Roseitalea porphyridii]QBK30801.1 imidazole glycerol phosphate synthase subunit HisH [Roseitalea porphyridii]